MHARVATAQVQPGQIDAYLNVAKQLKPEFDQIPGRVMYYQLMNRESHKGMMVAIYESEAAASAASGKVQKLLSQLAPFLIMETAVIEEYEVSLTR